MRNPFSKRDEELNEKLQELSQTAVSKAEMLYHLKQEVQEEKEEENVPLTMPEEKENDSITYITASPAINYTMQSTTMSWNQGSSHAGGGGGIYPNAQQGVYSGVGPPISIHDEADEPKEEKGLKKRIMPIGEIALVDGHKVSDEGALAMSKALGIPVIIMEDLTSMEFASIDQVEEALKQAKATLAAKTQENV